MVMFWLKDSIAHLYFILIKFSLISSDIFTEATQMLHNKTTRNGCNYNC